MVTALVYRDELNVRFIQGGEAPLAVVICCDRWYLERLQIPWEGEDVSAFICCHLCHV